MISWRHIYSNTATNDVYILRMLIASPFLNKNDHLIKVQNGLLIEEGNLLLFTFHKFTRTKLMDKSEKVSDVMASSPRTYYLIRLL